MDGASRLRRATDGDTSTRITYGSPPPRSEADATLWLTHARNRNHEPHSPPRHTHMDATAAQDLALDKHSVVMESVTRCHLARRDSALPPLRRRPDASSPSPVHATPRTTDLTPSSPGTEASERWQWGEAPQLLTPTSSQTAAARRAAAREKRCSRLPCGASDGSSPRRRGVEEVEACDELLRPRPRPRKAPAPAPAPASPRAARRRAATARRPPPGAKPQRSPPRRRAPEDLTIAGTCKLDPTAPVEWVREFRCKGKWYEVMGAERPAWAEDERVLPRAAARPAARRATGAWRSDVER